MKKTVLLLIAITMSTKILGFIREIALAYFYGTSYVADAYLISLTIPVTIFTLIGTGIVTGFIPIYSNLIADKGIKQAIRFTANLINIVVVICLIFCMLGLFFTPEIVRLFASGFDQKTMELTIKFTKVSIISIIFYSITFLMNGYLQTNKKFIITTLSSIPLNIIIITSFYFGAKHSIHIISIGSLFAALCQMIFLIYFSVKNGYKHKMILDFKDENIKKMAFLVVPVIIGVSVNQINILVDRTIASQITSGGISALNYANHVNQFIQAVFITSIITVLYPMFSRKAAESDFDSLKQLLMRAIGVVNIFILPITVFCIIFATEIISVLFNRGEFDSQATLLTSSSFYYYSIGMIGFGLREVLSRAFYSMQDTKTPMINAAIGMIINIVLNFVLSHYIGLGGLALATSISAIITTILLFISLRKRLGFLGINQIISKFIKVLLASLMMGAIAKVSFSILIYKINLNSSFFIVLIVSALTYFCLILIFKIEGVNFIRETIRNKIDKVHR